MRTRRPAKWTACGLVLGLLVAWGATAHADDKPPVLVGYVQKLLPDRDGGDREVAVEQARVAMKGTGNWVGSDAHGLFRVQLLGSNRIGQSIEVEVEGVPGWLLYQPADGRVVVPEQPQMVKLKLLPKGSLRFLGSQGLASLLARMMSEAKESARASPAVPPGSAPPPVDLKGPMQKWASEYGLSLAQVQTAVDKWAQEVLSRQQRDDEQVCLAHYSQKQMEQAALCFDELGQKDVQELERLKAQVLERTERAVRRFAKAADAYSLRYDFAAALAEYEKAARWAKRDLSPELWAEVQVWLGNAHWQLGIRVDGESSRVHLAQGVLAYRAALEVYTKKDLPQHWATTQNNLGNALSDQARRTQGTEGTELLAQAVLAFRSALEVQTKRDLPQHWAMTQNNLGAALSDQARRTQGTEGTALLAQAVVAYRSALEVQTKMDLPQHWAGMQNNLGKALSNQARRTQGTESTALLAQAVVAYRAALEVQTKKDLPQQWAMTQNNLGNALSDQASQSQGTEGTSLLVQSFVAYRAALEVYTKRDLPQDWAQTQNNLGIALSDQARRTQGTEGTALLAQAVVAYRSALEVQTKKDLPQDWAQTQNNLGIALSEQASRTQGTEGTALLAQAVLAYRAALEVYTKKTMPQHWAQTQNNLGTTLWGQASRTQGHEGTALLAQAVLAYRSALEVYTKKDLPQDWAQTQNNLGIALSEQASRTQWIEGTALLAQAVLAYRAALEVYTKKDLPQHWAGTQNNLGTSLREQASRTQGTEGTALLAQAVVAYRAALEVYTKKDLPQDWAMTQTNLGNALKDQAKRLPPSSPERKELLTQAVGVFRAALEIYTQTVFPRHWAMEQMNLGLACDLLSDDRCAADSVANLLRVYPDWSEGYGEAYVRYHEKLFLFAEAYALNRAWLDRHPDSLAVWPNFIESHLTTGRLAEVSGLLAKVFAKLSPAEQVPLLAIEVFALVGQGKPAEATSKRKALCTLIEAQPADFRLSWTFGGTRHFLQTDPRFSPHKVQLLALLSALEQPSRAAILSALDACCRDERQQP